MILLCPAGIIVHLGRHLEEGVLVLAHLFYGEMLSAHGLLEYHLYLAVGIWVVVKLLHTVVGELSAVLSKEVMTLLQGIHHVVEGSYLNAGCLAQLLHIVGKAFLLYVHGLVRAPCRYHQGVAVLACLAVNLVPVQVVYRVVGGAHALHVVVSHQAACAEFRQLELFVALVVYLFCRGR